jgi:hypothetical protein
MTIDEMIEELQRRRDMHGGQTPVRATCESVVREINPDNIYYAPWRRSHALDRRRRKLL